MYVDTQTEFSDAQAVTSTAISTNVIDLFAGTGGGTPLTAETFLDIGQGEDVFLVIQTAVNCTDSGSDATVTFTLESADNAGLSTNAQVHFSTGAVAFANYANAGTRVATIALPAALYRRYLGVRYTVASGPLTAGAFDAFLTTDGGAAPRRVYRSNFSVQ